MKSLRTLWFSFMIVFILMHSAQGESVPLPPSKSDASLTETVVKVFVTANRMDYYRPWQSEGIVAGTGSGVIIKGQRILTNAHVVSDHTFIQVKKDVDSKNYTAKVVAIGHDCDLALLEVDEPEFFEGITPLEFGELPKQQDSVAVIGYPEGGGKISITEGVVSRIEVTS
jgi:S1-C subfamily serine protease